MNNKKIQDAYPLSPMQAGLLFQNLYDPESDAYFVQSIFELEGKIDDDILRTAWQKVSDHHPILRTGFVSQNLEVPLQYVLGSVMVPFELEDWQGLDKTEQDQKLEAFIKKDRKKGFNLNKAPLFRLTLIQYDCNRYYLIWSQHHIIVDGWCLSIILGDVFKAYESLKQGQDVHLNPRPPYRDYIAWLQTQDLKAAEVFWKDHFASLTEPTKLSFSNIIKQNLEKDYDTYSLSFSVEETNEIKVFAEQHGLTPNTIIQGAVGLVLKTYTQRPEVVLGITVSGRSIDLPGIEEMVGLFINTLPLKITFHPKEGAIAFLKNLQGQTQKLNDFAYTPLAQIQAWSGINQSLFDVIFAFENYPFDEEIGNSVPEFTIKNIYGVEKTEYPLTIVIAPGKQLHLELKYQTKHFNEEIIKRLSDHIKQALRESIRCNKESAQTISILTEAEEHKLLVEWNDTKTDYPNDKTIHQLFEEQVEKHPNNVAVVYEGQELSYQHLNERANRLAHHLRDLGVGPDTLVGIAVERSLEMIVGLLGILKAGGAYVPLDPTYPDERLRFMLKDTGTSLLLTQAHLRGSFRDYSGTLLTLELMGEEKELCVEEWSLNSENGSTQKWISFTANASRNLEALAKADNLAYVIYTSGSTGKPKGVMVQHISICDRLFWWQEHIPLTPDDRYLHQFSFSFDGAVVSLWWPLLNGSSVIVPPSRGLSDGEYLIKLIKDHKITSLLSTPSMINSLLENEKLYETNCIHRLMLAGEILPKDVFEKARGLKGCHIYNFYGPTESTIIATSYEATDKDCMTFSVPIGTPVANTQVYILDSSLHPVPAGVAGDFYIGGVGLARGYLNQPDLTAEKFVPNPFVREDVDPSSLRLYRTGDLARYLPDGNIEFLGRIDDQVKVRGFRIELGEIESVLQNHEDVAQAVVTVIEDETEQLSNKKLVAYVVPSQSIAPSLTLIDKPLVSSAGESFSLLEGEEILSMTERLRNHLLPSLPDYMIPSFFVYIDKIPLTPNGKVDRKALPAPDPALRQTEDEYVAPRTATEQELCAIWQEVLKVEKVGIHDNFFKLGGHSLLIADLSHKIKIKFNKVIPLKILFEKNNIKDLALYLQENEPPKETSQEIKPHKMMMEDIKTGNKITPNWINSEKLQEAHESILLTGASGFLGIHLLSELIQSTNADIYCLVRGESYQKALEAFKKQLAYYNLTHLTEEPRVILVLGDLANPHLGLEDNEWKMLSQVINKIYHNGAHAHHIYDYNRLRAVNVWSTIEILKLASLHRPKHIYYISTISMPNDSEKNTYDILESFPSKVPIRDEGGYILTKWASERILADARERGFTVTFYRPPQIMGHSITGVIPTNNVHILLLIKGCIQLGMAPYSVTGIPMLPVDFISKFICLSSLEKECIDKVYNLVTYPSPSLNQIFELLIERGYEVLLTPEEKWREETLKQIKPTNVFFPLLPLYLQEANHDTEEYKQCIKIDNFEAMLLRLNIPLPNIDKHILTIYFNFLDSWLKGTNESKIT